MRTIIEMPDEQVEALDGICRRDHISRAEAVRRAVALLLKQRGPDAAHGAFGLWRGARRGDGLEYQQRVRREWREPAPRAKRR
ncbi:MAG: ribbon-helix-helix domain-containing protein [Acidobacteriota bacterium]|nr:ribbon-helix-helix domain-containing protein [Acidobacteriota bacterium]